MKKKLTTYTLSTFDRWLAFIGLATSLTADYFLIFTDHLDPKNAYYSDSFISIGLICFFVIILRLWFRKEKSNEF